MSASGQDIFAYCIIFMQWKQGGFLGGRKKLLTLTHGKDSIEPARIRLYTGNTIPLSHLIHRRV